MDGPEVELPELAEQRGGRWGAGHGDGDRPVEAVGGRVVDDADVDGRRAVEVGHALALEQRPDPGRVDLAQTDVAAGHGGDAPGEAPAVAVEHGQRPQVDGVVP